LSRPGGDGHQVKDPQDDIDPDHGKQNLEQERAAYIDDGQQVKEKKADKGQEKIG